MAIWDSFLTERDRELAAGGGYGRRAGFGKRPVVMVVDMANAFVGDRPEPIEESSKRWHSSCGEEGWVVADRIASLLEVARSRRVPIIYSTADDPQADGWGSGRTGDKHLRHDRGAHHQGHALGNEIIAPLAPQSNDVVIKKNKPSAFFGTLLAPYLIDLQADSVIICGTATSGCVRATAIDAFSYNFRTAVVEECTVDRNQASHALTLFDLHMKYSDVVTLAETAEFLGGLPIGLFDHQKQPSADPQILEAVR